MLPPTESVPAQSQKKISQIKQISSPPANQNIANLFNESKAIDTILQLPIKKPTANPLAKFNQLMESMQRNEEEKALKEQSNAMSYNQQYMFNTNIGAVPQINPMMYASMAYNMPRPLMTSFGFASSNQQIIRPTNQNVIKPAVRPEKKKEEPKKEAKQAKDEFDELYSLATNVYSQPISMIHKKKVPEMELIKPLPSVEPSQVLLDSSRTENSLLFDNGSNIHLSPSSELKSPSKNVRGKQSDIIFEDRGINRCSEKSDYEDLFSDVNSSIHPSPSINEKSMFTGDLLLL